MKLEKKTKVIQSCWAWIALGVNSIVSSLLISVIQSDYKILIGGFIAFFCTISFGAIKILRDIRLDDLSNSSRMILYFGVLLLSCIIVYNTYNYGSVFASMIVVLLIMIETVILIIIGFRYRILNALKKKK